MQIPETQTALFFRESKLANQQRHMPLSCPVYSPAETRKRGRRGRTAQSAGVGEDGASGGAPATNSTAWSWSQCSPSKKRLGQECKFRYLSIKIKYYNRSNVPHQINTLCWYLSEKMSFFSVLLEKKTSFEFYPKYNMAARWQHAIYPCNRAPDFSRQHKAMGWSINYSDTLLVLMRLHFSLHEF